MPGTECCQPGRGLEHPSCVPHVEPEVASETRLQGPASRESESWATQHRPLASLSIWEAGGAQVTRVSEDRKARETLAVPPPHLSRGPPRKTDTGAGYLLVGPDILQEGT